MKLSYHHIAPFLDARQKKLPRAVTYAGLGIGVLLLLVALQMFFNIESLLQEKKQPAAAADFISITRTITNDNMGKDNSFTPAEIADIRAQPFIESAAPLLANQFRVKASAGNIIPFSTDLFIESLDERFLDTVPAGFTWSPGSEIVPIVFSGDFLDMYNIFAPGQGLPQLSAKTISSVNINLECYGPGGMQAFRGRIIGLSDRVNSILVPPNFLEWANQRFAGSSFAQPSRVFLKTKDANSPVLLQYLESKEYRINKDRTRFGRIKQVLQGVVSGMGVFGILVILLALVLFSFYLQLMIARSKDNLQLLMTLGYSPLWLSRTVAGRWVPVYGVIILLALLAAGAFQYFFQSVAMAGRPELDPWLDWRVFLLAVVLFVATALTNFRLVRKLLNRL